MKFDSRLKTAIIFIFEYIFILAIAWNFESIGSIEKMAIVLFSLVMSGLAIQKLNKIDGFYGLMMVKYNEKLKFLDAFAKRNEKILNNLADFMLFLGYGIFSYIVFDTSQKRQKNLALFGVAILLIAFLFTGDYSLFGIALCGLFFVGYSSLAIHSFEILTSKTYPGIMTPIPGVNLPFFEGISVMALTIIFHEMFHGLYARLNDIDNHSAGFVLFGVIPLAAFVEIDEKKLRSSSKAIQNRVFVAGSLANAIITIIMLFSVFVFSALTAPITQRSLTITEVTQGSPAYYANLTNQTFVSINNISITTAQELKNALNIIGANKTINISTVEKGQIIASTDTSGKLGVYTQENIEFVNVPKVISGILYFIMSFLSLAVLFNFSVTVLNLLPIFIADGYRIAEISLPKRVTLLLAWSIVLMIIINILPWFD